MKKVVAIIQARMGSTRLPGKIMKKICDKTVLNHVIARVKQSKLIHEIVIATTDSEKDNLIVEEAKSCGVKYFRGSEDDVLSRYYFAAKENDANIVVRITSDCPLIDPFITDNIIQFYLENNYDVVTNGGSDLAQRTFPRGLDTEVFSFLELETAFNNATEKYQKEHVTPYIYEKTNSVYYFKSNVDYSDYRWTLDTEEDYKLISIIYDNLYTGTHDFYFENILKFIEKNKYLTKLNNHIQHKPVK